MHPAITLLRRVLQETYPIRAPLMLPLRQVRGTLQPPTRPRALRKEGAGRLVALRLLKSKLHSQSTHLKFLLQPLPQRRTAILLEHLLRLG